MNWWLINECKICLPHAVENTHLWAQSNIFDNLYLGKNGLSSPFMHFFVTKEPIWTSMDYKLGEGANSHTSFHRSSYLIQFRPQSRKCVSVDRNAVWNNQKQKPIPSVSPFLWWVHSPLSRFGTVHWETPLGGCSARNLNESKCMKLSLRTTTMGTARML